MKNITIKQINAGSNWVEGKYKGFKFQAKIYVYPSDFGINSGRVSKLCVTDKPFDGKIATIIYYERGWDIGEHLTTVYLPLVEKLEAFAQTEAFANQFPAEDN